MEDFAMTWVVRLSSLEFGSEETRHDTFKEAMGAVKSIAGTAAELNDGVEREIQIEEREDDDKGHE